jgi:hypothetical protein
MSNPLLFHGLVVGVVVDFEIDAAFVVGIVVVVQTTAVALFAY